MTRLDLAFLLCCCKACLGSSDSSSDDDFYSLLGLGRDATQDEIKRAYKRQSLQMHPDKLAQKGVTVTQEHQARFTRMKEAYEVSSIDAVYTILIEVSFNQKDALGPL